MRMQHTTTVVVQCGIVLGDSLGSTLFVSFGSL